MTAITMTIGVAIVIVAMVRDMLCVRVIVALVTYILFLSNCFYGKHKCCCYIKLCKLSDS